MACRTVFQWMLLGCLLGAAAPATGADPATTEILAKAQLTRGLRLYDERRYSDAATAFERAYALSKRPLLLLHLADAREAQGELARARTALEEYRPFTHSDERESIDTRIAALSQRIAARGE